MNEQPSCVKVGNPQIEDCRARDIWLELYADFARRRKVRAFFIKENDCFGMMIDLSLRPFALRSYMLKMPSIFELFFPEHKYASDCRQEVFVY